MDTRELFDVRGKTALVTGGSSGIGYMIAEGLVRAGVAVTICSRNAADLATAAETLAQYGEIRAIPADLASEEGVGAVAEAILDAGPLHILVNNAGAAWGAPLAQFPRLGFEKVVALNLQAPFAMLQAVLPALKMAASVEDPARVINISSTWGLMVPDMENYSYSASKAGLIHLGRHLGKFLVQDNINVNTIAPGPFPSKMVGRAIDLDDEAAVASIACPVGNRIGTPEDIVGGVIYLSSRAGAWLSGVTIPISGGHGTLNN